MKANFAPTGLWSVLLASTVSWMLFVAGVYFDIARRSGFTDAQLHGEQVAEFIHPSHYLTFAAITLTAGAALFVRRRLPPDSAFSAGVRGFCALTMLITIVLATIACISIFFNSFMTGGANRPEPLARIFNTYVPIILYTALIVLVIILGFVFSKPHGNAAVAPRTQSSNVAQHPGSTQKTQGALALAFAVPIIAVALGLIVGLITYDLTRSAPEAWIWVVIQALVAGGIIAGTALAQQVAAADKHGVSSQVSRGGVTHGARSLNFILTIIFAASVSIMSLSYGAAAAQKLSIQPYLSMNLYDAGTQGTDSDTGADLGTLMLSLHGYDLLPAAEAQATLSPGGRVIMQVEVDHDGYLYAETNIESEFENTGYTIEVETLDAAGKPMTLSLELTGEGYASYNHEATRMLPVTPHWIFTQLLPAFTLWLLTCTVIYTTLQLRHREVPTRLPAS